MEDILAGTFESQEKSGAFYVNGKLVSNGKTAADQLVQIQSPLRLGSCCGLAGFVGTLTVDRWTLRISAFPRQKDLEFTL
ncbi:MAG: hypothetical protein OXT74_16710 [Candidatus Poribacteria bacterium]|nr:hypothetical protein [Candidatus Poribacteria bacterium]